MKRFKWGFLLGSAGFFLVFQYLVFLEPKIFALGIFAYVVWLAFFVHAWMRPLERIMDSLQFYQQGKLPSIRWEKENTFTPLSEILHRFAESIHTHIQHAQEKDREMEGILDSLNEGVVVFNARSKVIFVNEVACKMFSVSRLSLIGRSLHSLGIENEFLQKCHEVVLHALQTSEWKREPWTSQETYFDLVASPLIHQAGAILVIQDKTSDYKILEMGKNFIANASHELRTPITIVRGFAEMLQNIARLSPQTVMDITGKIIRTCDRLDKLVKSLLRIADLEHFSQDRFRICNVASLFEHCKHLLLTAYPEVQCDISGEKEVFVLGDADLLDLAMMNLLENAVKYSPSPAKIRVSLRIVEGALHISVQDEGIGIPMPDLPHIFDRFYTVDKARLRKSGGAGLGLSIVKTIVEKHRGGIAVDSTFGKGSTFTMTLPILSGCK